MDLLLYRASHTCNLDESRLKSVVVLVSGC
jgi:hypothetical protein